MTLTKLIPATTWNNLPELDLDPNEDLFPQVNGDTYRPVRSDVASVIVPTLTSGTIVETSPTIGDTLSVTGSNAPAGATYQWQREGVDIAGETSATLDTTGLTAGNFRRQVTAGTQTATTAEVAVSSAAGTLPSAFTAGDWSIADLQTGGDAALTITALPNLGSAPYADVIQMQIDGGGFNAFSGGVNSPGTYNLNDLFTDGVAADVQLRVVTNNALFGGGAGPVSDTKSVTTTAPSNEPAPTITSVVFDDATRSLQIAAENGDGALTLVWATCDTDQEPDYTVAGGWTLSPYENGSASITQDAETNFNIPITSSTTDGSRRLRVGIYDSEDQVSTIQSIAFTADSTAPTFSSATTAGPQITITLSENISGSGNPANWDVQVAGASRGVSTVTLDADEITLTLDSSVTGGQTVTVAYTAGNLEDSRGNALASFTAQSVTNTLVSDFTTFLPLQENIVSDTSPTFTVDLSAYGSGDRIIAAFGTSQPVTSATLDGTAMTLNSSATWASTAKDTAVFELVLTGAGSATASLVGTASGTTNRNFLGVIATSRSIVDGAAVNARGATATASVTPTDADNIVVGIAHVETGGNGVNWSVGNLTEIEEIATSAASNDAFATAQIADVAVASYDVAAAPSNATGASNEDITLVAFVLE